MLVRGATLGMSESIDFEGGYGRGDLQIGVSVARVDPMNEGDCGGNSGDTAQFGQALEGGQEIVACRPRNEMAMGDPSPISTLQPRRHLPFARLRAELS